MLDFERFAKDSKRLNTYSANWRALSLELDLSVSRPLLSLPATLGRNYTHRICVGSIYSSVEISKKKLIVYEDSKCSCRVSSSYEPMW